MPCFRDRRKAVVAEAERAEDSEAGKTEKGIISSLKSALVAVGTFWRVLLRCVYVRAFTCVHVHCHD